MKSKILFLSILGLVFFSSSTFAATGTESGGGGDVFALQFVTVAGKVLTHLKSSPIQGIPLEPLQQAIDETVVESVGHELVLSGMAKDAINYPGAKKIIFNRLRWAQIADEDKPALVLHEYLGIIGTLDGGYKYSKQILGDFRLSTNFLPNAYCGTFKDNGDSFQIIDGIYNTYWDSGDTDKPKDPKGIASYLWQNSPHGKCYCIVGLIQPYSRGNDIAYAFTELMGLKQCQDIIK